MARQSRYGAPGSDQVDRRSKLPLTPACRCRALARSPSGEKWHERSGSRVPSAHCGPHRGCAFATWSEIDFDAKLWTIQPGREASKIPPSGKRHRVPLTEGMVALLKALPREEDNALIFWAPRGGALSDATLGEVMRKIHLADIREKRSGYLDARLGQPAVPHGLRSTFRTWVGERTQFDGDMAEIALAHKVGTKVQQAYDRSDQVEKRRRMMSEWEGFLCGKS